MAQLAISVVLSLAFIILAAVWVFRSSRCTRAHTSVQELIPVHHRQYSLVRERLARYDELLSKIQFERRETALAYLDDLREDFLRVERLLNHAAKFLPELRSAHEFRRFAEALWLRLEFRFLRLSIRFGFMPYLRLTAVTRDVAKLARWANDVLAEVAVGPGLPSLQADLNGR